MVDLNFGHLNLFRISDFDIRVFFFDFVSSRIRGYFSLCSRCLICEICGSISFIFPLCL